jgi:molybdopterin biosynthesis enzyme MoaB
MNDDTPLLAKVLTVSDGVFHGVRDDTGGRGLVEHLTASGFRVVEHRVTEDGEHTVAGVLREMSDGFAAPGLAEAMRLISPHGRLSRGIAGIRGRAIICNTPGSPKGTIEQIDAVLDVLPHALRLLASEETDHVQ